MDSHRSSYKDIALIAVFGLLWGLTEAVLGSFLHFFNVPLTGLVMTFVVSLFIFPAAKLIGRRGGAFSMALTACVVKLFSIGGFKIGPVIAIGMEGVLLEFLFPLFKRGSAGFIMSGVIFCLSPLFHQFFIASLLLGASGMDMVKELAAGFQAKFPFFHFYIGIVVTGYAMIHVIIGCLAGVLSWRVDKDITVRLQ